MAVNIQRDSYASYIDRYPSWHILPFAENDPLEENATILCRYGKCCCLVDFLQREEDILFYRILASSERGGESIIFVSILNMTTMSF
ncbi:hypothetical protein COCNU_05G001550 [Cocos nucifera]|uniref:Uncharacterized protein n=1 Tax=Cocos nucifera TaxID=13894 RepID=A0A8K0I882_COCNU|nr:hypothetical protein COCNU_05G001550 [Cocos nucifera]